MRFGFPHIFFLSLVTVFSAHGVEAPSTTWRLESNAYLLGKEGGKLSRAALSRPPELLAYQELRLRVEGKASKRVGYRIEPRFRLDVAPADTFSWVLDQGYAYANLTRTTTLFIGKRSVA